jgi:hypothetical protein
MHRVTIKSAEALLDCETFDRGDTRVTVHERDGETYSEMRLHGNRVAKFFPADYKLILYDAGWRTPATKDRLNGILAVAGLHARIYQQGFEWHYSIGGETYIWRGFETFTVPAPEPLPEPEELTEPAGLAA